MLGLLLYSVQFSRLCLRFLQELWQVSITAPKDLTAAPSRCGRCSWDTYLVDHVLLTMCYTTAVLRVSKFASFLVLTTASLAHDCRLLASRILCLHVNLDRKLLERWKVGTLRLNHGCIHAKSCSGHVPAVGARSSYIFHPANVQCAQIPSPNKVMRWA
jgi:hypothetical protein